jgi:hypothetical protein
VHARRPAGAVAAPRRAAPSRAARAVRTRAAAAAGPPAAGPRICVLGGGFGGLYTALRLESLPWSDGAAPQITLVDRGERFVFKPLLYELLSGEMDAAEARRRWRSVAWRGCCMTRADARSWLARVAVAALPLSQVAPRFEELLAPTRVRCGAALCATRAAALRAHSLV